MAKRFGSFVSFSVVSMSTAGSPLSRVASLIVFIVVEAAAQ